MPELEAQLRAYGAVLDRSRFDVADVVDARPRPARRSLIVAVVAAIVVAIAASTVAVVATRSSDPRRPNIVTPPSTTVPVASPRASGVLAIGDSVMFGARASLEKTIPGIGVDAVLSRQVAQAVNVLDLYHSAGTLPGTVVIDLGTNGRATTAALDAIMRAARGRQVFFVTVRAPRLWENEVNVAIGAVPARWPNAHVIDWREFAGAHDEWFTADGFHLTASGKQAYGTLIASAIGRLPEPAPPEQSGISAIAVVARPQFPPRPLAVASGLVWIATESLSDRPFVHLEGRDPTTATVVRTIDVPQEAVFGIAGDGDTLWVAGGGDGGVPQTTVSKVDLKSDTVVFTKTLTGTACSCPIVAGSAGVWLVGNGSDSALHLSSADGHVIASVALPTKATAAMELRSRLVAGLDDGTIAVVDPSTDRVERSIPRPIVGDAPVESVVALSPAAIPASPSEPAFDALIARANGTVDALPVGSWQPRAKAVSSVRPESVVGTAGVAWLLGADRVEIVIGRAVYAAVYDPTTHRFTKSSGGFAGPVQGFRAAVAAGDRLWAVYDSGPGDDQQPTVVALSLPTGSP